MTFIRSRLPKVPTANCAARHRTAASCHSLISLNAALTSFISARIAGRQDRWSMGRVSGNLNFVLGLFIRPLNGDQG